MYSIKSHKICIITSIITPVDINTQIVKLSSCKTMHYNVNFSQSITLLTFYRNIFLIVYSFMS